MTLEEEIIEAAELQEAFSVPQMVQILKGLPWQEIGGKHYLTSKDLDPTGLLLTHYSMEPTIIDNKWFYSVGVIMVRMRNTPDKFGSLFRSKVISGISK